MYKSRYTHDEIIVLFYLILLIFHKFEHNHNNKRPFSGTEEFCFVLILLLRLCVHITLLLLLLL